MLKWAVNGSRQSNNNLLESKDIQTSEALVLVNLTSKHVNTISTEKQNKELIAATPLRTSFKTTLTKSGENSIDFTMQNLKSVETLTAGKKYVDDFQKNYAPTLPSFDEEYSPCELIPGRLIAFRGMGLIDTYIKKPRYLTSNDLMDKNQHLYSSGNQHSPSHLMSHSISASKMDDITMDCTLNVLIVSSNKKVLKKPLRKSSHSDSIDLFQYWNNAKPEEQFVESKLVHELPKCSPPCNPFFKLCGRSSRQTQPTFFDSLNLSKSCSPSPTSVLNFRSDSDDFLIDKVHDGHIKKNPRSNYYSDYNWEEIFYRSCFPKNSLKKRKTTMKRRLSFSA